MKIGPDIDDTPEIPDIPDHLKVEGTTYQWCRCSCMGKPDTKEINIHISKKWRFVNPESALGLHLTSCIKEASPFIEFGGLVLMERASEYTDNELQYANNKNQKQIGKINEYIVDNNFWIEFLKTNTHMYTCHGDGSVTRPTREEDLKNREGIRDGIF